MSSGADGSEPVPGPGPAADPEKGRDPPSQLAPLQEVAAAEAPTVTIVISRPGEEVQMTEPKGITPLPPKPGNGKAKEDPVSVTVAAAAKEAELARTDSFDDYEQCRVCQQKTEEPLVDLGCQCRGDLSKAHRTCIDVWFRTRGSNKCEICQQVAGCQHPPSRDTNKYKLLGLEG